MKKKDTEQVRQTAQCCRPSLRNACSLAASGNRDYIKHCSFALNEGLEPCLGLRIRFSATAAEGAEEASWHIGKGSGFAKSSVNEEVNEIYASH